jgi:hypothetical protein
MSACIAHHAALLGVVGHRTVGEARHLHRRGVEPQRMLGGVVNHERPVGHCPVEERAARSRRRNRAEVGSAEEHGILRMFGRIGVKALDQQVRLVRRDAEIGCR